MVEFHLRPPGAAVWSLFIFFVIIIADRPEIQFDGGEQREGEDSPITRFQRYLRIDTAHPSPNYSAAVEFVQSFARSVGLQTRVLELSPGKPLLIVTWVGTNPAIPSILLNSHLDSVPAEPSEWLHPPFAAFRSREGNIFGRGAQDDKCIGMQYLEAVHNLRVKHKFSPLRTVHITYVPDEEIGGFDGFRKFAASKEFDDLNLGFALDEGQASVSNEYRVFYADRSPWELIIKSSGSPGHGSKMYDGSAMENLMKSMEVISRFRETQSDIVRSGRAAHSEVVSVNPVYLKAGIASSSFSGFVMNVQPSEAEAGYDLRFPPTADPELLRRRIVEAWAPAARNMTCQIKEKGPMRDFLGNPLVTVANGSNAWWSVFKYAIEGAGGQLANPEILSSTTDARYMRYKGVPVFGFSPMRNTPILLHDHNEFLNDVVYLDGIRVYEFLIGSLSFFNGSLIHFLQLDSSTMSNQ